MAVEVDHTPRIVHASVNFYYNVGGGAIAIRRSFNVASVTRRGVGLYTVNFTNPLRSDKYCVAVSNWANRAPGLDGSTNIKTVSSVEVQNTVPASSTNEDVQDMSVVCFD